MLRPKTRTAGYSTVQLPEFTGGVNSKDAATSIKDNQVAAAENFLFNEGEFKTRSGFAAVGEPFDTAYVCQSEAKTKVPWDWIYSKSHTLPMEHQIEERYIHDGSDWVLANKGDFAIKSVYVVHNSFRNTIKTIDRYHNHVYGNVNTWLITDTCEKIQAYLTQTQENIDHEDEPNYLKNPGHHVFNYSVTGYMTYSGKPVKEKGLGLFLYICGNYGTGKENQTFRLYELMHTKDTIYEVYKELRDKRISYVWEQITDEEFYVPTVLINGKGDEYPNLPVNELTQDAPQSMVESFNMLTPKFKAYFTTDGSYYTNDDGTKDWRGSYCFVIPFPVAWKTDDNGYRVLKNDFKITFTDIAGNISTITAEEGERFGTTYSGFCTSGYKNNESKDFEKAVRAYIGGNEKVTTVDFYYNTPEMSASNWKEMELPRSITNGLVFEGYTVNAGGTSVVGDMHGCEWFGGKGNGLSGGTRLFLYGGEYDSNHLMWSDVDNPLYFPANNYCYVGGQNDKITKLAKQGEKLIVFKKHSIHYTTYVDNTASYTAEDVLNGRVNDVAAVSAIFPVAQISGEIGCDLPSTMQLCDNNLVWCTSEGKIYTLKTTNQYSENNIYELSYPISSRLIAAFQKLREAKIGTSPLYSFLFKRDFISRNSFAVDYDGAYWLWVADTIFVMNYSDSGFKYAYSYREGNSVKRSIGFDVLNVDSLYRTVEATHTLFSSDKHYSIEELETPNTVKYDTRKVDTHVHYKSTGFIKGRNELYFILEEKETSPTNRAEVVYRNAQLFKLYPSRYTDEGMQNIISTGNDATNANNGTAGFNVEYGEKYDKPIGSNFTTKLYDFGGESTKKRVEHIYFDIFPKIDSTVTVIANTEKGKVLLETFSVYKAEGAVSHHIRCNLHGIRRLQLELSVSGAVAVSGFQIKYKKLGR